MTKALFRHAILLIVLFTKTSIISGAPQTEMDQLSKRYMIDSSKFRTPPNAIPLYSERIFPAIDDEKEGVYIGHTQSMSMDSDGLIYVPDDRNDEILVFADDGRLVRRFGRTGEGPGDFLMPIGITCGPDFVLIREFQTRRFQFFSLAGKYRNGFRSPKGYRRYLVARDRIIAAPFQEFLPGKSGDASLIDVLDYQGRIQKSFGTIFYSSKNNRDLLNWAALALTPKQEIAIASCFFPIVRLFSVKGDLIREFRPNSGIIEKTLSINAEMVEILKSGVQSPLGFVANEIFADTDGIYLAVAAPRRLEILLFDEGGKLKEYYYKNLEAAIGCNGLIVKKAKGGKRFFILRLYPQNCIEELRPSR